MEEEQARVNRRFDAEVGLWRQLYERTDLFALPFQDRLGLALEWLDRLELPRAEAFLEVGCGAGIAATELARRGVTVIALDSAPRMVDATRQRALEYGYTTRQLSPLVADAQCLPCRADSVAGVMALGVLDWTPDPWLALREMARVLRPGGWFVASCGHPGALVYLLDRPEDKEQHLIPMRMIDRMVAESGLQKLTCATVGFGPITLFRHRLLPEAIGRRVNAVLQRCAEGGLPAIRSAGMGYLVLAQKAQRASRPT